MRRLKQLILGAFSDASLKAELRRRGYATDMEITFQSRGQKQEFKAIGKVKKI